MVFLRKLPHCIAIQLHTNITYKHYEYYLWKNVMRFNIIETLNDFVWSKIKGKNCAYYIS